MNRIILISISALFLTSIGCRENNKGLPEITKEELAQHIEYLASDQLAGRLPGTEGDILAAKYIREQLASYGLKTFTPDGFEEFEITAKVVPGENNSLSTPNNSFESGIDFQPFAFSTNGEVTGEVVFTGYGFDITTDTLAWNDYDQQDIKGNVVMILRADPEVDDSNSGFAAYSADRDKCMTARDKGASGVLLVSGEGYDQEDEFESLAKGEYPVGIPVFRIKRDVADAILAERGKNISGLEKELNENRSPSSFNAGVTVTMNSDLVEEKLTTRNVVMMLEGKDPELKDEYVIIGGHFDHLGMGGPGTSSRAVDTVGVHHGADDNASGVASMIEIAGKEAAEGDNARTIIFAAFTAEEMGLLGSKYLVDNLGIDFGKVNCMINLDMVGRLKETRTLQIGGTGTAAEFDMLLKKDIDTTIFSPTYSEEGYGPSDHSSFYGKDIPVLFFSTGAHLDYHTPYDTPDKINYEGLVSISNLVSEILNELAGPSDKLTFREAGPKVQVTRGLRRKGVTLGIMPDFAGNIKNGLRADFVTPGRPADRGGMKKGDIIISINSLPVNNIQDYMFRLSKLHKGETITVEVRRGENIEVLLITL